MSLLIRLSDRWTRNAASAVVMTGLGLSGVAGCALNLSPGERLAASARDEQETKPPVATSALSRVLRRNAEESPSESEEQASSSSRTTVSRGRLFSAIVNRFPSRRESDRDPFLEGEIAVVDPEPQSAELGEASEEHVEGLNRRSLVQSTAPQRTDAELWSAFSNDAAGTARTRHDDPTLAAHERAPAQVDVASLPEWARSESPRPAERSATIPVQTASTATVDPPVRNADSNPFAKFESGQAAEASQTDSSITAAARKGLGDLISQARPHNERDVPQKARESALEGASFAPREDVGQVRPADAVGGLAQRPAGTTTDPFGDPQGSPAEQAAGGTSPFATGTGSRLAGAAPWTTQIAPEPPGPAAPPFGGDRPKPATPFPTAPEWRGVRANSPVSLAVVEQSLPAPTFEDPTRVRHADVADPSANRPGRLLPRSLPAHDPIFSSNEQSLALTVPPAAEGPLLAPPASFAPLSIAPPPAPEVDLTAAPVLGATDETHGRARGYGGWIIGGASLAAGMWLFGFGNRRPTRRHSAGEQK